MEDRASEGHLAPERGGFLSPVAGSHPVDHCVRCGRETPAGVSLCPEHNPKRLPAPSATQMHATIMVGMAAGVVGFFLLANQLVTSSGPYTTTITRTQADPGGGVALSLVIRNDGDTDGIADCRVTRDGVPRPDDLAFRSPRVPVGGSVTIEKVTPDSPDIGIPYELDDVSVICD